MLETNQSAVSLRDLFGDILEVSSFQHVLESSVLTLESSSNLRVTIIVSKSAGRYRVQSDSLEAMPLLISELEARLRLQYNNSQSNKEICSLTITYKVLSELLSILFEETEVDDLFAGCIASREVVSSHARPFCHKGRVDGHGKEIRESNFAV